MSLEIGENFLNGGFGE